MKVLLSIKPEFAEKIFDGSKHYEFRRSIFKNPEVKTVVVYASSPVQRVIGEFEIDVILNEPLEKLWHLTGKNGGIKQEYFESYFQGKESGFAIKVKSFKRYKQGQKLLETYGIKPPQSFAYLPMITTNQ